MATREGVEGEARWIRDTAAGILDEFARPRRVGLRSKRWWTDESPSSERSWAKRGVPIGQTEPNSLRLQGETSEEP